MKVLHLDELEATPIAGVNWKPVRAELDIRAFGINAYVADAGELVVEPHDEPGGGAGKHQELYVVASGAARFVVAGEELDAPAVTFVLVEPEERREAHATEDGTTVLALGGKPGEPFKRSEWEFRFRATRALGAGGRERAKALLEEGLQEHPGSGGIRVYQAVLALEDGDEERAIALVREAVEHEQRIRGWIPEEPRLDPIRDRLDL